MSIALGYGNNNGIFMSVCTTKRPRGKTCFDSAEIDPFLKSAHTEF